MKLIMLFLFVFCMSVLPLGQDKSDPYFVTPHYSLTDGEELYSWCKGTESVALSRESRNTLDFPQDDAGVNAAFCYGYVNGIVDSMPGGTGYFAPDSKVTLSQYVAVVTLYLHDHPERWHQPAAGLVHIALHEKFKK